jgi:hypothetical protein
LLRGGAILAYFSGGTWANGAGRLSSLALEPVSSSQEDSRIGGLGVADKFRAKGDVVDANEAPEIIALIDVVAMFALGGRGPWRRVKALIYRSARNDWRLV